MFFHLAQGLRAHFGLLILGLAVDGFVGRTGQAHVLLDSPNGGETLNGGSTFTLDWHIDVEHNTLDWDVWYSTTSSDGPWLPIVENLAVGDITAGTPYSLDWNVPNINAPSAWVRVLQDNAGMDYDDVSDASFRIAPVLGGGDFTGDGSVNAADLSAWEQGFGKRTGAASTDGDADLDADVDGADFLVWQSEYVGGASAITSQPGTSQPGTSQSVTSQSVPEPAATVLLLLGMVFMWCLRR